MSDYSYATKNSITIQYSPFIINAEFKTIASIGKTAESFLQTRDLIANVKPTKTKKNGTKIWMF